MFGLGHVLFEVAVAQEQALPAVHRGVFKSLFDVIISCVLICILLPAGVVLAVLNPVFNQGPLIYRQTRMGQGCRPFTAYKFRTMSDAPTLARGAFDAVETDRITALGRFLRKTRLDELPQIINVLRGEMSLIGPRPDCYNHAQVYVRDVPDYAKRCAVLPGISGYAQTEVGYVEGFAAVQRKVAADLYYIRHASFGFDLWITWRTIFVVLGRKGS